MPHQPTDEITVTITATASAWQDFISYNDNGPHRIVRIFIDQIMQQARAADREHSPDGTHRGNSAATHPVV